MRTDTRAAVVRQRGGAFTFERVEIADPRPDEVFIRVVGSGICHTDIAARDGLLGLQFPAVFGHETAGVIEKIGRNVSRFRAGDRVLLSFSSCGKCRHCREGHPAHCLKFDKLNFEGTRTDGSPTIWDTGGMPVSGYFLGQSSFAQHVLTRERNVIPVDAGNDEELAMLAPLGCGLQAGAGTVLHELKPQPRESIIIFGVGAVGLSAVTAARLAGITPIIAVDIIPSRLHLAKELGATVVINSREENVDAELMKLGDIDHAVETTGLPRVIDLAIRSIGPKGKVSLLGISSEEEGFSPKSPGARQTVFYSIAGDSDPHNFIPFLIKCYREGKFPFDKLIKVYSPMNINEAVRDSIDGVTVKPVLRF